MNVEITLINYPPLFTILPYQCAMLYLEVLVAMTDNIHKSK